MAFRNLTHPTVSPFWGRAKADGEDKAFNAATAVFGINWIPVVDTPVKELTISSRLAKRTVCGELHEAKLFIGDDPTTEYDWNLILRPKDPQYVSREVLEKNAKRVRPFHVDLDAFHPKSGKYFDVEDWHADADGNHLLEVEVTAPRSLLASDSNPLACKAGDCVLDDSPTKRRPQYQNLKKPNELCAYGPWVQEAIHGYRPEIHPAEAIYWQQKDGSWELLMLQDASRRFDSSRAGAWFTVFGSGVSPQTRVEAEHWVQEAMIGEFVIPVEMGAKGPMKVEILGQQGLETIGSSGYPEVNSPDGSKSLVSEDSKLQVFVDAPGSASRHLVVRAQIRGAPHESPLTNNGAYLHLRVSGTSSSARDSKASVRCLEETGHQRPTTSGPLKQQQQQQH